MSSSVQSQYWYNNKCNEVKPTTSQKTTANYKTDLTSKPDTITINGEEKTGKKGLSKGAKWGIGALAVAGIATLACVLSKGRVGKKEAQQLAEHIEFTPAKTVEEAKKFAQDKLKILYNNDGCANLDMLNTINEMCTKNMKYGKVFDAIHFESRGASKIASPMGFSPISDGKHNMRVLRINTDYIDKFDDLIKYAFKHDDAININNIIKINTNGTYSLVNQEYSSPPLNKLIDKLNAYNKKSTYKDKLEIYDGFSELCANYHNILNGRNTMKDFSFDGGFIHEAGHSLHYNNSSETFNALLDDNNELVKEFHSNSNIQQIAQRVSDYAKTDPSEFVAEVYKGAQRGKTFDNEVMALYKKYGGPELPA